MALQVRPSKRLGHAHFGARPGLRPIESTQKRSSRPRCPRPRTEEGKYNEIPQVLVPRQNRRSGTRDREKRVKEQREVRSNPPPPNPKTKEREVRSGRTGGGKKDSIRHIYKFFTHTPNTIQLTARLNRLIVAAAGTEPSGANVQNL